MSTLGCPQGSEKGRAYISGSSLAAPELGLRWEGKDGFLSEDLDVPNCPVFSGLRGARAWRLSGLGCGTLHLGAFWSRGLISALSHAVSDKMSSFRVDLASYLLPQGIDLPLPFFLFSSENMENRCKPSLQFCVSCLFVLTQLLSWVTTGECVLVSLPMSPYSG